MKKKIAILSLIAIFVSVSSLSAQTKTVTKTTAKTEVKAEKTTAATTPACCKGKEAECCKGKTAAEKAKCVEKCKKQTTKTCTGKEKACPQKADTKKAVSVK